MLMVSNNLLGMAHSNTHGGELCIIFLTTLVARCLKAALLGACPTEMMQDYPLHVLDDGHARRFGRLLGLRMTGTVGVLARATRDGLVPRLAPLLDRLAALGFRLSAQAQAMALTLVGEAP